MPRASLSALRYNEVVLTWLKKGGFAAALALLVALPSLGVGFTSIDPRIGVIYVPTTIPNGADGYPAGGPPLLTYVLGVGTTLDLGLGFAWEPALDFFTGTDLWDPFNSTVLPTELSWRTSYTMNFLVQLPFSYTFRFAKSWSVALALGPAFDLRWGLLNVGPSDVASASPDMPKINAWFWEQGRWFQPETALRVGYRLTDRVEFSFSGLAYWPVYDFWLSPKPTSMFENGIFGGELLIKARIK
jgi:hypothetical protein